MKTKTGIILLGQGEGIMKTKARIILLGLVMVIALCYVNLARAESNFATGAGPQSAAARLDFQITIPKFVYFSVGQTGVGVDQIDFTPTVTELTTEAVTTGSGGDIGSGTVTVALISNGGGVTITPSNNSGGNGLSDGLATPNYISYAQINSASNDPAGLPAPALSNAGGTPVNRFLAPDNRIGVKKPVELSGYGRFILIIHRQVGGLPIPYNTQPLNLGFLGFYPFFSVFTTCFTLGENWD